MLIPTGRMQRNYAPLFVREALAQQKQRGVGGE